MKDFTIIPNDMLRNSQLSVHARYLFCVMLRYCGKSDYCFPSQQTLANDLGYSDRHVRDLIKELERAGLVVKTRKGYNRANTYTVAKIIQSDRKSVSSLNDGNASKTRKSDSVQLGTMIPIHQGSTLPPNSIYLKGKDNNSVSHKGLEKLRKDLIAKGILKDNPLKVSSKVPLNK